MPKAFKTEQTGDRQINAIQDNVRSATQALRSGPFGAGNLVKDVEFSLGITIVDHGLGRTPQGFIVVRYVVTNGTTPYALVQVSDPTTTIDTSRQFALGAANSGTADIWFF